jgi:hypothetical protein
MATSQRCCHLPGEMLNSAAECADRARICILSPLLWNFVIDTFLEIFKAHTAEVIAYADDGALIVTADDMDTAQHHMQTAIDKAQAWAEVVGL